MSRTPKVALGVGFGAFVLIMIVLLAPTVMKPKVATFTPTPAGIARAVAEGVVDTITVDAGDELRWSFVDLDRGAVLVPPDTAGWDLMVRRFHLVPSGAIAKVASGSFDSLQPPDTGYIASRFAHDTANAATDHWYLYGFFSHLLAPKPDLYVVRTRDGRFARLQLLSYYCPGVTAPTPGCVTFRYAFAGAGKAAPSK
jgi:hypothetical protein